MFGRFLDWFERHKVGVIGTLMLHTFMMFAMAMSKLPPEDPEKQPPVMEMEMAAPQEQPPDPMLEPPTSEPFEMKSLTSNVTAEVRPQMRMYPGQKAQERMAGDIEEELMAFEAEEFRKRDSARKAEGKEVVMPQLDPSKWDPKLYMPKKDQPVKVQGNAAVSHDLEGRSEELSIPAYLCIGQGVVNVSVSVDRDGTIRKAEIDEGRTRADDCMKEEALNSVRAGRFNSSSTAPDPQRGTITYIFMAQ